MKSILSNQAKQEIRLVAHYIRQEFGKRYRDEFIQKLRHARHIIEDNPNIGSIEPLLEKLPGTYRSYVMNHYNKIVYRVDSDVIYISDLWDVRRAPDTLINQIESHP